MVSLFYWTSRVPLSIVMTIIAGQWVDYQLTVDENRDVYYGAMDCNEVIVCNEERSMLERLFYCHTIHLIVLATASATK